MSKYPECEKMSAVREESQAIGQFLDWLCGEKEYEICSYKDGDILTPIRFSIENLLAEFFDIDLKKVEKEKHAMLVALREKQK